MTPKSKPKRWPNPHTGGAKRKPYTVERARRKLPSGAYIREKRNTIK